MDNKNQNKETKAMAELFYNMYIGCLKFKEQNPKKSITCDEFYKKFTFFAERYVDSKTVNNGIVNNKND